MNICNVLTANRKITIRLAHMLVEDYYNDLYNNGAITISIDAYKVYDDVYTPDYLIIGNDFVRLNHNHSEPLEFLTKSEVQDYLYKQITNTLFKYTLAETDEIDREIQDNRDEKHEELTDLQYAIRSYREDIEEKIEEVKDLLGHIEDLED